MDSAAKTVVDAGVREPFLDQPSQEQEIDRPEGLEQEPMDLEAEASGRRCPEQGSDAEEDRAAVRFLTPPRVGLR